MSAKVLEFWTVQNTGWSAGISWFDTGGTATTPGRFDTEREAREFLKGARWGDRSVKWRLVQIRIKTTRKKRVTTERYIRVK